MATDKWATVAVAGSAAGSITPAEDWADLSSSINDSTALANPPRALYAHVDGSVRCVSRSGSSATFTLAAGEIKPLRPYQLMSTGTSTAFAAAGTLIGLY